MHIPPEKSDGISLEEVLGSWYRRARESQFTHYRSSNRCAAASRWLGIPSVVLSAIVGTTLFATLEGDGTGTGLQIAAGLTALVAAALAALHTFLGYDEKAAKHRSAAAAYGAVRREIEQHQILPPKSRNEADVVLTSIRRRLDDISDSAPDISTRVWRRSQKDISHTSRPEGFSSYNGGE